MDDFFRFNGHGAAAAQAAENLANLKLPREESAKECICWGEDQPEPCDRRSCRLDCRACRIAGRPFWTDEDRRYLDDPTRVRPDYRRQLQRLGLSHQVPKSARASRGYESRRAAS